MNTLLLTPHELEGMNEPERKALEEAVKLVREGEVGDALQKVAENFNEVWKLRTAVRVIYGELVRGGRKLGQAYLKVKEALQKIKPKGKRQIMQEGLEDHYQNIKRLRKAIAQLERRRKQLEDRLKGVTLTDILMEMRYGSGKWCD
jgi:predicted RNase H-like nuclease (RuvC/YqgF family)